MPTDWQKNINRSGRNSKRLLVVQIVLSDIEKRATGQNQRSQRCERHKNFLHLDIASFFKALFSASRTGYIRYAIAGPVNFSKCTQ